MAVSEFEVRSEYLGNGLVTDYTFDFRITSLNDILIIVSDEYFNETFRVRGTDLTYLTGVTFDPEDGGGTVSLVDELPLDHHLAIVLAEDDPVQLSQFKNKGDFTLERIENALDSLGGAIQRLVYRASRVAVTVPDRMLDAAVVAFNWNIPLPLPGHILRINSANDAWELIDLAAEIQSVVDDALSDLDARIEQSVQDALDALPGGGAGLPAGGSIGDALEKLSGDPGDAEWKSFTYSGFSSRFGVWDSSGLKDTIDKILDMTRLPPLISLSMAGSGTVREKGTVVASSLMTATVTKRSDPIAEVRFYQGVNLLNTQNGDPPVPSGGVATHNYATPFSDTISFTAQVDDNGETGGPSTVTSNTVTFTFIYPYYWGNGASGLDASGIVSNLTKVVANRPSSLSFVAPGGQRFYLVYPQASGNLSSIRDASNFETINDWTLRTVSITGLDGNPVTYNVYEFNNTVVAGTYPYTFS